MLSFVLIIIGSIPFGLLGGWIGLRSLLYVIVAFIAGFAAVAANIALFDSVSEFLFQFTEGGVNDVLTFLLLTMIPLVSIGYKGRKIVAENLKIPETISVTVNKILGGGFLATIFIVIAMIIRSRI